MEFGWNFFGKKYMRNKDVLKHFSNEKEKQKR